jgi:hypothetical protein
MALSCLWTDRQDAARNSIEDSAWKNGNPAQAFSCCGSKTEHLNKKGCQSVTMAAVKDYSVQRYFFNLPAVTSHQIS